MTTALQQRDDEWREELAEKDRALRAKFREREKAFIGEQLKRDQELLKLLEISDKRWSKIFFKKQMPSGICTRSIKRKSGPPSRRGMKNLKPP